MTGPDDEARRVYVVNARRRKVGYVYFGPTCVAMAVEKTLPDLYSRLKAQIETLEE